MKRLAALSLLLLFLAPAGADEIVLKSGKTLTGRIINETDKAYTIRVGPQMNLSVEKVNIIRVQRDVKAAPPAAPAEVKTASAAANVTPVPAPKAEPAPVAPPVAKTSVPPAPPPPVGANVSSETSKTGVATIIKTISTDLYAVAGTDFASVKRSLEDEKRGRGVPAADGRRAPSKTEWAGTWTGTAGGTKWKALEVSVAVTMTLPDWKSVPDADRDAWNRYLQERAAVEAEHKKIISDGMKSFALSASNLSAADEKVLRERTNEIFEQVKKNIDNRRRGFDRRRSLKPLPKPKG